jgi:hypothetical protein
MHSFRGQSVKIVKICMTLNDIKDCWMEMIEIHVAIWQIIFSELAPGAQTTLQKY